MGTGRSRSAAGYDANRADAAERSRERSLKGREITPIPPIVNVQRRARAATDFRFFCETYFPETFPLAWSIDHLKVIEKIEQAVLHGGLFAVAMPRGSGKSSLAEIACLWALLFGHHEFVCLIGSAETHAQAMLDSLKSELENNDLLMEDFPDVCGPVRDVDGIAARCSGQLCDGERTNIGWNKDVIVLATIPREAVPKVDQAQTCGDGANTRASGAIVRVAGLTGSIRGMKFKRPDGRSVRPSLVVLDDPQTDESAKSLSQCSERERVLAGAVLGLAGPRKKIAGIMPCTVIRAGDMADAILDREKHPEWNGERTKMVYKFPVNEKLWDQYAELRSESLRRWRDIREATKFYSDNRAAMDAGAEIAWPERFNPDELSAIQNAMNLLYQNRVAFYAEYQNEPVTEKEAEDRGLLDADQIAGKLNGYARGVVPLSVNHLTAFVDVQGKLLYYMVMGWQDDFTGFILDYGSYPDQKRAYYTLRDAKRTLAHIAKGAGPEGQIYAGLKALTEDLLSREWMRDDGAPLKINQCLIDANWGQSTQTVYNFCRQSSHAAVIIPSHGKFVGASSKPFREYAKYQGDRVGLNWRMPKPRKRIIRHVLMDVNYWKSFMHHRLASALGDKGSVSIFGRDPHTHRLLADHLLAEYRVQTAGRGRTVDEWKPRPGAADNHWLDCLVGCGVAASMLGVTLPGAGDAEIPRQRNEPLDLLAMQRSGRTGGYSPSPQGEGKLQKVAKGEAPKDPAEPVEEKSVAKPATPGKSREPMDLLAMQRERRGNNRK